MKLVFQDVLTFEGRAYLEKMQWDKTEMLFYLQEERRKRALTSSQVTKELTMDGFIGSFEVVKNQQARVRKWGDRKIFIFGMLNLISRCLFYFQMMSSKMGVIDERSAASGADHRSLYIPTAPSMSSRTTMRTIGTVVPQL